MLKGLIAALLAANLGFLAWSQGWLAPLGLAPHSGREPERLARQLRPEDLQVLPPQTLARRTPPPVCVESGPYSPAELPRAENVLRNALAEGSWQRITRERPGQWMVYMGPYTRLDLMQRRMDDLRKQRIAFEEVRNMPDWEPGVLFGRYSSEADARSHLTRLQAQKVRYARVVRLAPPTTVHTLRLPRAEAAVQVQLPQWREAMGGKAWTPCSSP